LSISLSRELITGTLRCFSTIASLFSSASGFNSLRLFCSSQISSSIALKNLNTSTEDKLPC
ncbi:hypothetical protein T12_2119, partial [Trichinella patagoniensis]